MIPFLLRGVNLLGIDSVMCPRDERIEAWHRLARDLPLDKLDRMTETVPLSACPSCARRSSRARFAGGSSSTLLVDFWNSPMCRRVGGA